MQQGTGFRKVIIGMAAVLVACLVAAAGYRFGQSLARADAPPAAAGPRTGG